ncbi:hypothetical protein BJY24_001745 [Nocardia transvalensis]|uniref:Uncharacterized protein n=1 Tax=Nocardia transvalensis TaxID=37333 RepID=A0A7W9PBZ7_9NOCA|nr:hypothetical protein [Nocardia transvalensis]MBB5912878.1 hypothetical protein [Nocardia transvalensis]
MTNAAGEWLSREAVEHLEMGPVGVYELLWLVRGAEFGLDDETAKAMVRRTVDWLLSEKGSTLVLLKWPTGEIIDDAPEGIDTSAASMFEPDASGVYLALVDSRAACEGLDRP